MNLRTAIQEIAKTNERYYDSLATVISVDGDTCDVMLDKEGLELWGVRLSADKEKGFRIIPKVGSKVIVSYLNKSEAYVSMFSEVDLYTIQNENESLNTLLSDLIGAIEQLTVSNGAGVTGVPINVTAFTQIKTRLKKLFKE
jgi:hypothetical protein